jgi:hypothetical protein
MVHLEGAIVRSYSIDVFRAITNVLVDEQADAAKHSPATAHAHKSLAILTWSHG